MPTYSYRCTECDTAFDIHQAFTDNTLTQCPTCEGKLRKVFSSIGVTFNGSGFYRNDSRDTKSSSSAPVSKSTAAATGAKESKPTVSAGSSSSSSSSAPSSSSSSGSSSSSSAA